MVPCWRRNAKSTLGRAGRFAGGADLTGGGVGATVALAVATTSSAGTSRLWPTASSLVEAGTPAVVGDNGLSFEGAQVVVGDSGLSLGCSRVAVGDSWLSLDCSQAKRLESKGRLVF